jgi:hypothetical protein
MRGRGKPSSRAKNSAPSDSEHIQSPWINSDLFFLESALRRGLSFEELAGFLGRTSDEVEQKAKDLKQVSTLARA